MPRFDSRILILDACVLIDFYDADASVLAIISQALGPIHVASTVLAEVEGLDESAAESLGLRVIEPSFAAFAASAKRRGGLSPRDHICLILAKGENWTCVSNDKALRSACAEEQVAVLWGLEMMGLAVEAEALPGAVAEDVARRISQVNPMITDALVERFIAKFVRRSR